MKKKITAVLLCVALLLTLSVSVSADTSTANTKPLTDTQITPIADEVTVNVGENDVEIIQSEISDENMIMPMAQTSGIVSGGVYRIKNVASGKYMNVDYGIDANGTNIYQWTGDGSTEQKFRVVYYSSTDSYMFYAMCSSNGTNRVLDVTRGSNPLTSGQNIKLYNPTDPTSQEIKIVSLGSNNYKLVMNANQNLAVTSYGTSNGSASGTTSTSAGNIFISTYTGTTNQQWQFELLQNPPNPTGSLDSVSTTMLGGWAYETGYPDTPIWVHFYIKNNSTSEQTFLSALASGYRSDLEAAGYGDGEHAFNYSMNWYDYPAGTYTVSAYAIGSHGVNPQLSNSPKTFTVRNMTGVVDYLDSSGIRGWAWKPDAPDNTVAVNVYVRNSANETVGFYNTRASNYRSDLENAGYGDGEHGFSISIDWSTLPEENLRVTAYAVDGTGIHPAFYDGYYENRKRISLLGMVENKYFHDLSEWSWTTEVETYCDNIGCSYLYRTHKTDAAGFKAAIKNSSYCVINTHGSNDGKGIQWSMKNIYNEHFDCQNSNCYVCYGWYTVEHDIDELPSDYFDTTRCVVLMSCYSGLNGSLKPDNIVNTLHSKGVWTVVGFKGEITYYYDNTHPDPNVHTDDIVNISTGAQLWITQFTKLLGEGKTVEQAICAATKTTHDEREAYEKIHGVDDVDNYCGLNFYYVAGDGNQIVKH